MSAALDAARSQGRLVRHAPTLVYHRQEPFWASSPEVTTDCYVDGRYATYLQRSDGQLLAQAGPSLARSRLTLGLLDGSRYGGTGAAVLATDYLNAHGGTYAEDARRMQADPDIGDKVYGRYVQAPGGRVWLQYWLYYSYNDKSLLGIGLHEGDWEMIQVGLGDDGEPAVATYAQHTRAEKRDSWDDVRRDGTSPLVFVALGSHASYFDPAEYRMDVPGMFDHARGNGRRVKPRLVELTESEGWLAWPGRWGRLGLSDKSSPQGPLFHDRQFNQPDEFHRKARGRRLRIGPIALDVEPEGPAPKVTAVRDGDEVVVTYDLRALRSKADPVARLLVSVESTDARQAPATHSFVVTSERASIRHPVHLGDGDYVVHVTAMTVSDAESETVTVPVEHAPRAKADREGFALRLLVELPPDWAGGIRALRTITAKTLGQDADGDPWQVTPLFGPRPPARLRRHVQVTGTAIVSPAFPPQQQAFDLAHRLGEATGAVVQPDLPSSAFSPPADEGAAGVAGVLGGDDHDTSLPKDWALKAINCKDAAWHLEPTRGGGILIGHPDTGFTDHHELEPAALALGSAWDVLDSDRDAHDPLRRRVWWRPLDSPGHGTGTASAIVGRDAGEITGVAPGATLVPLRTIKSVVQVFDGDVAVAIERARRAGCHVVSMSLGGVGFADAVRDAVRTAVESGLIVMAAAGNYVGFVTAPARWPECIAVGATNVHKQPWSGSSRGPEVDFCAPGEDVWAATAWRDDDDRAHYDVMQHNGTSFAVANTAGAAALWLRHHGVAQLVSQYGKANLQALFVMQVRASVDRPQGWDRRRFGAGILDVHGLLAQPLPDPAVFAAGPLGGPEPPAPAPLDVLAPLFPELRRAQLRAGLSRALGVRGRALDRVLEQFGGELLYQFSEDATLRQSVVGVTGMLGGAEIDGPAGDDASSMLRRTSSAALAMALGG